MDIAAIKRLAGKFIVLDGPDGSGKSTQFARLAACCREAGLVVREVREPGGTPIGEQIRAILLSPANTEMGLWCEMMLYMASRAQLVEECIRPALDRGELVLADRFISSTLAYQGTAGGLDCEAILSVGRVAVGSAWPDLTVILDLDGETAARRIAPTAKSRRHGQVTGPTLFCDRVERRPADYHRRVRQGFLDQAEADRPRHLVIDATPDPDRVFAALLEGLADRFG